MNKTNTQILVADIGGTNARFALADPSSAGFSGLLEVQCADFSGFELALDHFNRQRILSAIGGACIAAAGPVVNQQIKLTNNHWRVDASSLSKRFGGAPIQLLNDFEAIAWSVPWLGMDDVVSIGDTPYRQLPEHNFSCTIIGPGTGLGVAGLVARNGRLQPIVGEGGHVGFAPENARQLTVWQALHERGDRVTIESLVSGPGLENIYRALEQESKQGAGKNENAGYDAADIFQLAESGNPIAVESVAMFFEVLGQAAGDFALSMGSFDGVFIAGGIVRRYPQLLSASRFREAFENKGPYRQLMQSIPCSVILHPQPGLLGASYCAQSLAEGNPV